MAQVLHPFLQNKVAVVTGGSGVLCSMMAIELASQGAKVALLGRSKQRLEQVVSEIAKNGGTAIPIVCDVLEEAAVKLAAAQVKEQLGDCQLLINGAGGNSPAATTTSETFEPEQAASDTNLDFFNMSKAGFASVIDLNLLGTILPAQHFGKQMVTTGGSIINLSSMSAYRPMTKVIAYSAAKAAIDNVTQWLAVHLADANIRVNAIAPGFFLTEQNRKLLTNEDGSLTSRAEKIMTHTPMRRFGQPTDLLGTLLWLADCTQSGFVTGITVPVDGGFMAYSGV